MTAARPPTPRPRRAVGARLRRRLLRARLAVPSLGPWLRRALDIAVATAALAASAPVLLVATLLIRLTSRGPAFFAQERVGLHGRRFTMYKLRTMVPGADALRPALVQHHAGAVDGVRFKLRRDPRVTAVGAVLRRFSVDELPQLWNVLRGEMTLVGPRPALWREVLLYDARALRRLEVRPGLTCLWQVGGRSDLTFDQQVVLDLEYIDRARLLDEVLIVARTIPAVFSGRGAY
jgi:lipopolysaccharide/colanic/teichoic acid biosynthesis glycosyltransferase